VNSTQRHPTVTMASQISETRKSNVSRSMVPPPMLASRSGAKFLLSFVAGFIALTWIKVGARPMDQYENVAVSGCTKVRLEARGPEHA
jgi:hypothetical protein